MKHICHAFIAKLNQKVGRVLTHPQISPKFNWSP